MDIESDSRESELETIKVHDDEEKLGTYAGVRERRKKKESAAHQAVKSIMVFLTLNDSPIFRCNFHTKRLLDTQSTTTTTTRVADDGGDDRRRKYGKSLG